MRRSLLARAAAASDERGFGDLLESLRQNLRRASDFMEPWNQFHDQLMATSEVTTGGASEDSPLLNGVLSASAAKLLGRRHEPTDRRYFHLAEYGFWHGMCQIGPYSVIFFYFETGDVGLAGFSRSLLDNNIELIRFSTVAVPPGAMPVLTRGQS